MTCCPCLFLYWRMRLTIFIRFRPEFRRIIATLMSFHVEVMRLLSSLIDEILRQLEVAFFSGCPIQFHERQFNCWMAAVTALLAFVSPKQSVDMVGIATDHIQQFAFARCLIIGD